ncbi:transposase family protein [Streptomyces sp. NPDC047028]|uniref:transposase family protein n=1 Tax=Streptomyces sp. NPDC047028 TaxID=3155793 RepID=UPI0033FFADFE
MATHRVAERTSCTTRRNARRHGMNVQVVAAPDGTPLCFSRARARTRPRPDRRPCSRRDRELPYLEILVLDDHAYQGAGATIRTPYYHHHELPEHYQQYNRNHARLRTPGGGAFAQLKTWRLLRRARCSTNGRGRIVAAIHTFLICGYGG